MPWVVRVAVPAPLEYADTLQPVIDRLAAAFRCELRRDGGGAVLEIATDDPELGALLVEHWAGHRDARIGPHVPAP